MEDGRWYDTPSKFDEGYSLLTRQIVRYLSENARMSILELSKALGTSRRTVREKLLRAEKELGIHYTAEFNDAALGLSSPHLIRVKFTKTPNFNEIAKILSGSYIPQLAVVTKGTFDLIIYANAITSSEYVAWDKRTQIALSKYGVLWHSSDVAHMHLGFFPIRNELIDRTNLDPNEKAMLKLLNTDSRMTFSDMSKQLTMHFNTVAYNFNKLMKSGYIKRFTVSMDPPKDAIGISIFGKYVLNEEYEANSVRSRLAYKTSGTEFPIMSRYPIVCQLVGSSDAFITGFLDDYDIAYNHIVQQYKKVFGSQHVKVEYGKIEKIILGRLPLRSVDAKKEYSIIKWTVNKSDLLQD